MYANAADSGGLDVGDHDYTNENNFTRLPPAPMTVNTRPTETGKDDSCFQKNWSRTSKVSLLVLIMLLCIVLIIKGVLFSGVAIKVEEGKQSNTTIPVNVDNTGSSCKTCPFGWKIIRSNCYFFSNITETWEKSKELCAEHSGILVVIKDESEMYSLLPTIKQELYWIGLRRDPKDTDKWVWTDGSPLTYSVWDEYEPNNLQDNEHCVELRGGSQAWNDRSCLDKRYYICKGVWRC